MLASVVFGMGVRLLVGLVIVAASVVTSIGRVVVALSAAERYVLVGVVLSIASVAVSKTDVGVGVGMVVIWSVGG